MTAHFDTIIVGAGAAGCVLANRLTADGRRSVLLLEAGPDYGSRQADWPADLLDPTSIWPASHDWGHTLARRDPAAPFALPRTCIVGGTTAVNGCVWLRGSASDYDDWAARGNPGWGFADLLPYFQRAESDPLRGPLAGTSGPVPVYRVPTMALQPAEHAFMGAAAILGHPIVADLNATADQRPSVGPAPKNIAGGVRMNAAFTYLAPSRDRPNLTISPLTSGDRVVCRQGRATGVTSVDGRMFNAPEVILCAGAYGSPAILQRSGIGPGQHLQDLGIAVEGDLPGVGGHLLDHPLVSPDRPAPRLIRPEASPPTRSFIPVIAKSRSRHAGDDIDLHIYMGQDFSTEHNAWFFWITASLQYARSRGRVRITAADPRAPLEIDHAYFSDPADLEALVDGVAIAESIMATNEMRAILTPEPAAPPPWEHPDALPAWILDRAGTTYHPSSTCRMGPASDPRAVVDHTARVHGLDGLWVADASIFPTGPRANIHFTVVAVAEKVAEGLLRDRGY